MLEVEGLSKSYGRGRPALDGVSFRVEPGEIVGLLGENGAGKSTLLRILAGLLFPSGGRARIGGSDVVAASLAARAQLGYLPEQVALDDELRVSEYLELRAALKGVAAPRQAVAALLAEVGLGDAGPRLLGRLSRGYRQRVGLADALLHRPPLVLLDEPTAGLDPNQRRETLALIRSLAPAQTVLLSTHLLPEAEALCQKVVVLHGGRLLAVGSPASLRAQLGAATRPLELDCRGDGERLLAALRQVAGVAGVSARPSSDPGHHFRVELEPSVDGAAVAEALAAAVVAVGWLRALRPEPATLDHVFAALTAAQQSPR
jgi:ABC-2 type transport system ATP-binding protein